MQVERKAWDGVVDPPLGGRTVRPRHEGLTMVIDKGLSVDATEALLDLVADYVDLWKLPFGTSAFYSESLLSRKIEACRRHGLDVYPGGTFLEVALWQGRLEPFLDRAAALGFTAIEVSDGTIPLTPADRRRAIREARARGFRVVSEVGKKEPGERISLAAIRRAVEEDLAAGAERIIVEGRESGEGVGIYDAHGNIQEDELAKIVAVLPSLACVIWEAPRKSQQEELIRRFGPNVNLGNIPPEEVLALEALRTGLRADTLRAALAGAAWPLVAPSD
jgi:phosphosulfolactate synthase